jgi:hypothetical protein
MMSGPVGESWCTAAATVASSPIRSGQDRDSLAVLPWQRLGCVDPLAWLGLGWQMLLQEAGHQAEEMERGVLTLFD